MRERSRGLIAKVFVGSVVFGALFVVAGCSGSDTSDSEDVMPDVVVEPTLEPAPVEMPVEAEPVTSTEGITMTEAMTVTDGMTMTNVVTGTDGITMTEPITVTEPMSDTEAMTDTLELPNAAIPVVDVEPEGWTAWSACAAPSMMDGGCPKGYSAVVWKGVCHCRPATD